MSIIQCESIRLFRLAIGIRIHLHTDAENVSSGFKGRYVFEVAKSDTGDCGGNYSGQESDVIMSPNYPGRLTMFPAPLHQCDDWF